MDLGMNDSVPESGVDNGNSVPVMNHGSSSNADSMRNNGFNPDDDQEESIGSPPQQANNNVVESFKAESPGGSVHSPTRKGFGLKKWRRIKRDGPVKDEAAPVDDGTKLLKRGLMGLASPPSKHVDVSSVEARQSSEGSVGSVNMVNHHHQHQGIANGFSPNPGFMFTVGQAFEKNEEHSGNSISTKNVGGKGSTRKGSEERVKAKNEKPCSSLDSDLRSSDFVFSSGAVSVANHIGEFSKEGHVREEVQTYNTSGNGEKDEDGNESKRNNLYLADKDPLADSIRSFAALQEALWKEVQSFQELGKESTPLHSNIDQLSSSDQSRDENCREEMSASSGSQVLILKQKLKHLEHKIEEATAVLEAKEARIQELENSKIESELEGIFQKKMETEIEHLMLTRSLKSLQVLKQCDSLTEDPEPSSGNMLGKTCKFGFYFLTQMILLLSILQFLILQFSPASRLVIPT